MDSSEDFEATSAAVGEGQTLCATLRKDGTPVYFVMQAGLSDTEIRDAAFEVREGRQMSSTERWALDQAIAMRSEVPA